MFSNQSKIFWHIKYTLRYESQQPKNCYYKKIKDEPFFKHFTVLKGIEYDTIDAGHILIIMPEYSRLPLLELRGLPVTALIKIVHFFGGILGPAHPCGEKFLSFCHSKVYRKNPDILKEFDFLESFNACESSTSNHRAHELARYYGLLEFGGSDSHKTDAIGFAYTEFEDSIFTESDLIRAVKKKSHMTCGGRYYHGTTKEKIGIFNKVLVYSFFFYNKAAGLFRFRKRKDAITTLRKNA